MQESRLIHHQVHMITLCYLGGASVVGGTSHRMHHVFAIFNFVLTCLHSSLPSFSFGSGFGLAHMSGTLCILHHTFFRFPFIPSF